MHTSVQEVSRGNYAKKLSYCETAERFGVRHKRVQDWERIYLTEGPEGVAIERRGRGSSGRSKKLPRRKPWLSTTKTKAGTAIAVLP